jgi:hydroxymethylbilane synthase
VDALRTAAAAEGIELGTELVTIHTSGDAVPDKPFEAIGPKGVFAAELERALLDGEVDLAVHSLKDLPAVEPDGLVLAAVLEREDARDVLVSRDGKTLAELPPSAVVGTSSARRAALVAMHRPELRTAPLRGNVDTRLEKIARGDVDAGVLAAAGLLRLDRADAITEFFDPIDFVPPPGQGALVIEARAARLDGDLGWVRGAEHARTRACVDAERVFMGLVEGGCEVPLGAWARFEGEEIVCEGFVAPADGSSFLRATARGTDPQAVGTDLADRMLAEGAADFRKHPD